MTEKRKEFLERIGVITEEERIARGLDGEEISKLPDRGNVFMNARVQSEAIIRKAIEEGNNRE